MAHAYVQGSFKLSSSTLETTPGENISEKIKRAIQDEITRKNPSIKFAADIKFRAPKREDEDFLARCSMRLAEKEAAKEEAEHEYIGELIGKVDKKIVLFTYPEIKDAWRQQRDIWNSWKEFIRVFIDDSNESEKEELEQGDVVDTYQVLDEIDIRKKLLRDYPEDSEKLGFQKIKKEEPQT